ncbi:MAG TPA: hypothetical protein VEX39_17285 [Thermoleophilaceae bacterium]|nr:hypothetical protein [Thermoleophilaceae bacterium]
MSPEEPGLLGNLPRSRPGTRSDKRKATGGSKPAPKRSQAAKPGVKETTAAKKPKAAAKKPKPKKPPVASTPPPPGPQTEPPSESRPPSPGALESAVKVAGAGLRVAEGVTREVLRRLPRP